MLSRISGTPCECANLANFSISNTTNDGLDTVSANTAFVLGLNALASSSSVASGSTNVKSRPSFLNVTLNKLNVPP